MSGRWFFLVASLALALRPVPATAEELVTSLSSSEVLIESNFTGAQIVIFGQVDRDKQTVSRPGPYDLAVVLRGPDQIVTTRRKDRLLGLWVNREAETFYEVPSFYVMSSTRPPTEMGHRNMLEKYGIGINYLNLPISPQSEVQVSERDDFRDAFLRLRRKQGVYSEQAGKVDFLTESLFRTTISLPATTPVGVYSVDTFLLHEGAMLASQTKALTVAKTGFEQAAFDLAHQRPALYGILAVITAVFTGWLAGVIFRKD
ncbi:TIGR02186 family protein [Pannonibacter carbonis]|uniref:TIGR02186 family protein n=1 Tax=Pannonibacter carbonis TaxID=2067569 RepID=UPI000D0F2666|nr:TIGR02186 family protein [Pannonibacter carbonis]